MSTEFDPYLDWLEISGDGHRPDHYTLLGLSIGCDDQDLIHQAHRQRIKKVRNYQQGRRGDVATRILNELADAYSCLKDPVAKSRYDLQCQRPPAEPSADVVTTRPLLAETHNHEEAGDPQSLKLAHGHEKEVVSEAAGPQTKPPDGSLIAAHVGLVAVAAAVVILASVAAAITWFSASDDDGAIADASTTQRSASAEQPFETVADAPEQQSDSMLPFNVTEFNADATKTAPPAPLTISLTPQDDDASDVVEETDDASDVAEKTSDNSPTTVNPDQPLSENDPLVTLQAATANEPAAASNNEPEDVESASPQEEPAENLHRT